MVGMITTVSIIVVAMFLLPGPNLRSDVQHEAEGRVSAKIVSVKTFAPEEPQPFVEFYGRDVVNFGL